jgi:nucleotide-binding universal stress UspA family protein
MYRRIAVALDTSPESRQALRWAAAIARRANCPLDLIRVAVPAVHGDELYAAAVLSEEEVERLEREALQDLRDRADEVASDGVRATPVVLRGDVPTALTEHLRESGADLAVMTVHDRGRLERLLLGHTSESVVRRAHIPMLLIRAHKTPAAGETVVDVEPSVRRMLVPIDGSPFSEQILAPATTLASVLDAGITLLSVMESMLAHAAAAIGMDDAPAAMHESRPRAVEPGEARTAAEHETLERIADRVRALGIDVDTHVLVDERPAHAIVAFAVRHQIDLIAMTTHGRGALKRIVAGSVTESVLHSSSAHMLLYRPEHPAPS